jgi:RNA polymerase sigma-70 factor (ECF subfamily)
VSERGEPAGHEAFARWAADLRTFVRRRVADEHTADDLAQEVLARFAVQLQGDDPPRDPAAWLFRVARNRIVDHLRAARTRQQVATVADERLDETASEPVDDLDLAPLHASFRAFVHELPPLDREALLLTHYEGLTQAELALRLGVPLSTAKSRVQRARARLAQALAACCTFELDRRGGIVDYRRRRPGDCCSN